MLVVSNIRAAGSLAFMTDSPPLSTNTEDCLEAILRLIAQKGAARVRDIAAAMGVHKSTVSSTLKCLAEKGLVNYSPYEITTLTPRGQEIARNVSGRHEVLRRFLAEVLAIDDAAAETNACRMEHILDAEVLDRLAWLVDFAGEAQGDSGSWAQRFQRYSKRRSESKNHTPQPVKRPRQRTSEKRR
jgi:DtxR family transcriptional regulator, Mn-dependent transcriptional regulator